MVNIESPDYAALKLKWLMKYPDCHIAVDFCEVMVLDASWGRVLEKTTDVEEVRLMMLKAAASWLADFLPKADSDQRKKLDMVFAQMRHPSFAKYLHTKMEAAQRGRI